MAHALATTPSRKEQNERTASTTERAARALVSCLSQSCRSSRDSPNQYAGSMPLLSARPSSSSSPSPKHRVAGAAEAAVSTPSALRAGPTYRRRRCCCRRQQQQRLAYLRSWVKQRVSSLQSLLLDKSDALLRHFLLDTNAVAPAPYFPHSASSPQKQRLLAPTLN